MVLYVVFIEHNDQTWKMTPGDSKRDKIESTGDQKLHQKQAKGRQKEAKGNQKWAKWRQKETKGRQILRNSI